MRRSIRSTTPAAIVAVAALLLTGCGSDDSSGGSGGLSFGTSGGTGGAAGGGSEGSPGGEDAAAEGHPMIGRWEGDDVVLVVSESGSVYAIPSIGAVCSYGWKPLPEQDTAAHLSFVCDMGPTNTEMINFDIRLRGDNEAVLLYSPNPAEDKEVTRVEDLNGVQVDLEDMEKTILG
jgi:hypothetical protein